VNAGNAAKSLRARSQQEPSPRRDILNVPSKIWKSPIGLVRGRGMQGVQIKLADIARALSGVPGFSLPSA
jgi:hypothetical protein